MFTGTVFKLGVNSSGDKIQLSCVYLHRRARHLDIQVGSFVCRSDLSSHDQMLG